MNTVRCRKSAPTPLRLLTEMGSRYLLEYRLRKAKGLPFLLVSFFGNKKNPSISIVDSRGAKHRAIPLPAGDTWLWNHVFAYCPTMECTLVGSANASGIALLEPKEIGPLSICAVVVGEWGRHVFGIGAALFSVLLISLIVRDAENTVKAA